VLAREPLVHRSAHHHESHIHPMALGPSQAHLEMFKPKNPVMYPPDDHEEEEEEEDEESREELYQQQQQRQQRMFGRRMLAEEDSPG
jgi:hypothetical protein